MVLVEFIVEWFEAKNNDKYYHNMRIDKPDNASDYLQLVRKRYKLYNDDAALDKIILSFREGKFGPVTLDDPVVLES